MAVHGNWRQQRMVLKLGSSFIALMVLVSCANSTANSEATEHPGKEVYTNFCVVCHGEDGKMKLSGAYDLSISDMTVEQRILLLNNGGQIMPPFKEVLNEQQIADVADYIENLK